MWTLDELLDAHWADYYVEWSDGDEDYYTAHSEYEIKEKYKQGYMFRVRNGDGVEVDEVAEEDLVK